MKKNSIFHMAQRVSMYRLAASLVLFLAIGLAREAAASPLAYEGFNYVINQPLSTMNGGTGWAGSWTQISGGMVDQPPTLSYPAALPSTGDALSTFGSGAASRSFLTPLSNTGSDLWISFMELTAVGAVSGASVELQQPSPSLPDIDVNKDAGGAITLNGLAAGVSAGVGNVDFFVLQLVQWSGGATLVNLFVDPGVVLGPPNASLLIPGLAFQAQQFYYQSNAGQVLDEIRVGTTPLDVAAVPEPSTFTMLAGALLLLPFAASMKGRCVKKRFPINISHNSAIAVLMGLVVGTARLASAQYDPSLAFSPTSNPNGVWSYGFESVPLGSTFNLLTLPAPVPALPGPVIDSWQSAPLGNFLGVFYNETPAVQTVTTSGTEISQFDPGMLAMNAGPNDEFAIVQFTAPTNGFYTIQGTFEGIDTLGTASSVFLLWNNAVITNGNVLGFGPGSDLPLSSFPILLNAGDTLAYAVGGGSLNSMTALIDAQVSAAAVPEPSPCALLGLALVTLAARSGLVRKRKAAIV
jgi:hypothetical protein